MNARAARHILQLRSDEHADLSIREWAWAVYEALLPLWPSVLADATVVPASEGVSQVKFLYTKV